MKYLMFCLKKINICLALSLLIFSCASPEKAQETSVVNAEVPVDVPAATVVEVHFPKGQHELSKESQNLLLDILKKSGNIKNVETVRVISWPDQTFSPKEKHKKAKEQRKLAESRNHAVALFIKKQRDSISVETYNMAERPQAFETLQASEDISVKKALATVTPSKNGSLVLTSFKNH